MLCCLVYCLCLPPRAWRLKSSSFVVKLLCMYFFMSWYVLCCLVYWLCLPPRAWRWKSSSFVVKLLCLYAFMYWYVLCCLVYCLCLPPELGGGNLRLLLLSFYAFIHLCLDMCCVVLSIVYVYHQSLDVEILIFCC